MAAYKTLKGQSIRQVANDPTNPVLGEIWYNTTLGVLKGYLVCICIFSLLNWFYPYQKWSIETESAYTFEIIYNGSEFLTDELPNSKDYYENTEKKIKDI